MYYARVLPRGTRVSVIRLARKRRKGGAAAAIWCEAHTTGFISHAPLGGVTTASNSHLVRSTYYYNQHRLRTARGRNAVPEAIMHPWSVYNCCGANLFLWGEFRSEAAIGHIGGRETPPDASHIRFYPVAPEPPFRYETWVKRLNLTFDLPSVR